MTPVLRESGSSDPKPCTLHPKPYILNPKPLGLPQSIQTSCRNFSQAASAVNRLLLEAGTFVVAELRNSLDAPSSEPSRRLSAQERSSRLQALQSKLGAFRISGQYEPSHQLVDQFSTMLSDQSIRHVPLNRCSSREQEVSNLKHDEHLFSLENSALRLAAKPQTIKGLL